MSTRSDAPSAIRETPVFNSRSFGSLCVVPSGKMAIAPPAARISRARANVSRFDAVCKLSCLRYTGIESKARAIHPITGIENSGAFARNETRRGAKQRTNSGSTRPFG